MSTAFEGLDKGSIVTPRARGNRPNTSWSSTSDQLLARGHVFRGYLGAGLQRIRQERANGSQSSGSRGGVLVVSIDPNGPSARAGILVGDIVTAWNGPGDVKSPRVIVTPPSSRFCPWLALRPPHYAVRRNGEPI
jgi:hypothetical protein